MARLSIRTPDEPDQIVTLTGSSTTIGRGRTADITVRDKHLSREHCQIQQFEDMFTVNDLGSRNGVRINGQRISGAQQLITGDMIQIGQTHIMFVTDAHDENENEAMPADNGAADSEPASETIMLDEVSRNLDEETAAPPPNKPLRFVLQYKKGERRRFLPLTKSQLTIGRHKSCGLILRDKSVSSCHAAISFHNGLYEIHDLGSTNGIKINGKKVDQAILNPGTRIRLGNVLLSFKEVVAREPTQKVSAVAPAPASRPATTLPADPLPLPQPPTTPPGRPLPDLPLDDEDDLPEEDVQITTDESGSTPVWSSRSNSASGSDHASQSEDTVSTPEGSGGNSSDHVSTPEDLRPAHRQDDRHALPTIGERLEKARDRKSDDEQQWIEVKLESDPNLPQPDTGSGEGDNQTSGPPPPALPAISPQPPPTPSTTPAPEPVTTEQEPDRENAAHDSADNTGVAGKSDIELKQLMTDLDQMLDGFEPDPNDTAPGSVLPLPREIADASGQEPAEAMAAETPGTIDSNERLKTEQDSPAPDDAQAVTPDEQQRERKILIRIIMTVILVIGLMLIFLVPWDRIFAPPANLKSGSSRTSPAPPPERKPLPSTNTTQGADKP